ncbi:CHAT domain-containing protein [Altericroceibacterium endophyticum]|uniref:CHAT domain-containing protein n=1 Tax=Altericroceibacterium endophyticum TaxID=1808508 RepID=A0A6I4T7F8_9SPHN|nr:CHAT domain-containing protein [Altericroceibacterium endophyticum]MXO66757.1 CHAT domain-containing protein [Altericroceibacterium endophyticum]
MRFTIWCSTSIFAAAAALSVAAPLYGQKVQRPDIYNHSVEKREEAQAALAKASPTISEEERARLVSNAIIALAADEKNQAAWDLYREYQSLPLDPAAQASAIGVGLNSFAAAEEKPQLRAQLRLLSDGPPLPGSLGRPWASYHLGMDAYQQDDMPGVVEWLRIAYDQAREDLGPDDPTLVYFAARYAEHVTYLDREKGAEAGREAETLALRLLDLDHPAWISVLSLQAQRALSEGRYEDAVAFYARSTDVAVAAFGYDDPRLFPLLQSRAVALSGVGRADDGERFAKLALRSEWASAAQERAMHRSLIGELIYSQGRVEDSVPWFREGLTLMAENKVDHGDLRWGHLQSRLSRSLSVMGEHEEALRLTREILPQFRAKLPEKHPARTFIESLAAFNFARAGHPAEAIDILSETVANNEARLLDIYAQGQDLRRLAFGNNQLFRDSAIIALLAGDLERGWRSAQLASLGDLAASAASLSYPGDAAGFARALDAARTARSEEEAMRSTLTRDEAARGALADKIVARKAAEDQLAREYPDYVEFLRPRPLNIAEAREVLDDDQAYVVPIIYEDRVVTLALTREGLSWGQMRVPLKSTNALIKRLRSSLDRGLGEEGEDLFDVAASHELYNRIFTADIQQAIAHKTHLIFPAGGLMAQIPPSVLLAAPAKEGQPRHYLLRDYAISVRPTLRRQSASMARASRAFAGIGAPTLAGAPASRAALRGMAVDIDSIADMPSLPGALAELASLSAAFAPEDSLLLTGAQATEASVRAAPLDTFQVIAFATHGLVNGQVRGLDEPALVLTPVKGAEGSDNDALLTASEIAGMRLTADWVLLSACNTASPDGRGNPAFSGLARAFQLAGARSLLLSHWPVRDDAAAAISVATLKAAAAGTGRAMALRNSQLALIEDEDIPAGAAPAIWAPFILVD